MCSQINVQLINLVESVVWEKMQARESFTALDISNDLKQKLYPFRHREVAEVVREIYDCGAMARYDYRRESITVLIDHGTRSAEAYLYHHDSVRPGDYGERDQSALPPVPPDLARDISDTVAAGPLGILVMPRNYAPGRAQSGFRSKQGRRDGALAIPRSLLAELGWAPGTALSVSVAPGTLTLGTQTAAGGYAARVWTGFRMRICKSRLAQGALAADKAKLEIDGSTLRISRA